MKNINHNQASVKHSLTRHETILVEMTHAWHQHGAARRGGLEGPAEEEGKPEGHAQAKMGTAPKICGFFPSWKRSDLVVVNYNYGQ